MMSTRIEQYQNGCLRREARQKGPDVWVFRWREQTPEGTVHRKQIVGTVEKYPTRQAAEAAVGKLRITINEGAYSRTVGGVVVHYIEKELPTKAFSTQQVYRDNLKNWILSQWGNHRLSEVKAPTVEEWLAGLSLAPATKAKIRNVMVALFQHAMRNEWIDRNPIRLVRQSAKRKHIPEVLDAAEIHRLLGELNDPFRLMVLLAGSTGVRVSELLALQWGDIDFDAGEIRLRRGIYHQVIGDLKTEASGKPVPLDHGLAEALCAWRGRSAYNQDHDWVFASPEMRGQQPYWPDSAMRCQVRPAAKRAGIKKRIGWHTFRHSYGTLLKANGEDVKTVQESLRHANSRITLDTYVQALTPAKREAQHKVVEAITGSVFPRVPKDQMSRLVN